MTENLIIRDATNNDLNALTGLMNQLGYTTSIEEFTERFSNISKHDDYKTLVGVLGDQIVVMAGLQKGFYYELNGTYIRLLALVVDKDFRKTGVARKMLESVDNWAATIGAGAILLNCGDREERREAHLFYHKVGYSIKSKGYIKRVDKKRLI